MSEDGEVASLQERVEQAARARDYGRAQQLLLQVERLHQQQVKLSDTTRAPALVSIASDVLGPNLTLDSDGVDFYSGGTAFTVVSPYPERAAAALEPVMDDLYFVDEEGSVLSEDELATSLYTPEFVHPLTVRQAGVLILMSTGGTIFAPMACTMVRILEGALVEHQVPAHLRAWDEDLP